MVDLPILPRDLPPASEVGQNDSFIVDKGAGGLVNKVTADLIVDSVAPLASQADAEVGTDNANRMSPLRVKQSIASEVGVTVASYAAGQSGLSAVQSVNGKSGNAVTIDKTDVGLGSVDNTSDANKPISTAMQTALDDKANESVEINSGVGLAGGGDLSESRTIELDSDSVASLSKADSAVQPDRSISAGAGLTGGGTLASNRTIALSSVSIASLAKADSAVQSVNGKTGESVTLVKADVGLGNVDNTSDANKPISTAAQAALSDKFNNPTGTTSQYIRGDGSVAAFPAIPQGTVTSVGMSVPTGLSLAGSPITTSGSFSVSYAIGYQGYTTAEANKLAGIAAGAQVNTVNSVAGKTGAVTLDKADVGLGNVDNTSDANKPISTSTQAALNAKANSAVTIAAGTGLTGGGNLTANRSISLNPASVASLSKADTALQALGGLAGQVLTKSSDGDNDVEWVTSEAATAVSYGPQVLTEPQKSQARDNIGAISASDIPAVPVTSVNTKTGDVVLSADDVGAATAAQGALASTAVQPDAMSTALDLKLDKTAKAADSALLNGQTAAQLPISTATQAALNAKAGVYTGGNSNNTNFPVGSIVVAMTSGTTNRQATATPRLGGSSYSQFYDTDGSTSALSGTWRSIGKVDLTKILLQRVA